MMVVLVLLVVEMQNVEVLQLSQQAVCTTLVIKKLDSHQLIQRYLTLGLTINWLVMNTLTEQEHFITTIQQIIIKDRKTRLTLVSLANIVLQIKLKFMLMLDSLKINLHPKLLIQEHLVI